MNPLFQSTRRRLALWYTIVTAVLLFLFATGVYLYVRSTLIDRIDDTLKHVVEVVNRSIIIQPTANSEVNYRINWEASFRHNPDAVEDDHIDLEWFNREGKLLWWTFSEPLQLPLHPNRSSETVYLSGNRILRQLTERVEVNHQILGYLRVSHPWFEVTKPIHQLTRDLAIGISLMVLSVAGIGWLLSGIAIEPVRNSYSSLKQFTADASHELRNPIATIQTNVQMALAYPEAEPQLQQRQLKVIERLTQRLGRLVNDLLFLARSDSGIVETNFELVPLDALLIEVIEEQKTLAEQKNIFLSLHLIEPGIDSEPKPELTTEEVFTVPGDWNQLARLFTNLIANAIEHTKAETQSDDSNSRPAVEVELQRIQRHSKRGVRRHYSDSNRPFALQVKVKDNGKGIPESALPCIFDRFYRADPSRSHDRELENSTGAGLGLAIAKAIVENHQGQITVESQLARGTTFTVILPQELRS
jgi:OmpR-family two-component system manganese-sensing sensor histidine kinase